VSTFNPPFDVILAADVIYERKAVILFLKTAWKLSGSNTLFLMFWQIHERDSAEAFWQHVNTYFDVTKVRNIL
jgi:hypothetical protein